MGNQVEQGTKMNKLIIALILIISISCAKQSKVATVKVYYFPIGAETYTPITMKDIEKRSLSSIKINLNNKLLKFIKSIINKSNIGKFDNKIVRMKIIYPNGKIIYIDNDGGVNDFSSNLKMDKQALYKIKNLIEKMMKGVPVEQGSYL